ncbi:MAG: zinc ribbon domain-containing protein [Lachnospiraceae bacterium]|nr:zinc ribbon domain-containing protein [Lachnospiraceae bacterium]
MICKNCGTEMGNNVFCPNCGAKAEGAAPQQAPFQQAPQQAPFQQAPQQAPYQQMPPQGGYQQPPVYTPQPAGPPAHTFKSKIGVSTGMFLGLIYLIFLIGSSLGPVVCYIPAVLIAGYVLIKEEDRWLRINALKAILVVGTIDFVVAVINFLPHFIVDWIDYGFVNAFSHPFGVGVFTSVINIFTTGIDLAKEIILIILIIMSLMHKSLFNGLDRKIDKHV